MFKTPQWKFKKGQFCAKLANKAGCTFAGSVPT
jgi:hypothetical protein